MFDCFFVCLITTQEPLNHDYTALVTFSNLGRAGFPKY